MGDDEVGSLFCGRLQGNYSGLSDDVIYTYVVDRKLNNQCYVHFLYMWPHVVMPLVLLFSLLYERSWGRVDRSPNYGKSYQLTFPLERLRCFTFVILLGAQLMNVGEGFVTDAETQPNLPSQPQLYVPPIFAMIATIVAMSYYQKLEVWNKPCGLGFLLLQWVWSFAVEFLRLSNLVQNRGWNFGMSEVIILILLMIYAILIIIEFYVYVYKSRLGRHKLLKDIPDDLLDDDFRYTAAYTNFYSALRFSRWMPVFSFGEQRAPDISDLGICRPFDV